LCQWRGAKKRKRSDPGIGAGGICIIAKEEEWAAARPLPSPEAGEVKGPEMHKRGEFPERENKKREEEREKDLRNSSSSDGR